MQTISLGKPPACATHSARQTGSGVARALLSDGYKRIDHLDLLTAILSGVERAGVPVQVAGCDLTERRMYVRLYSEQIVAHAPVFLLAGYRSPFTGAEGAANPAVWGGLVITNSETGNGAAAITPQLVVEVCRNGYTITADAHRRCTWAASSRRALSTGAPTPSSGAWT